MLFSVRLSKLLRGGIRIIVLSWGVSCSFSQRPTAIVATGKRFGDGQTNLFDNWTLEHLGNEHGETIGSGEDGEMAGIPEYFHQQELASIIGQAT